MKKLTSTLALALIGVAVLNTSANAQSASQGDLILGFQVQSGNTNKTLDFESDLGNYGNFINLAPTTVVNETKGSTSAGQTGAFSLSDLTTLFGSDTIRGDVSGVVANDPTNTLFISQSTAASAPAGDPGNSAYTGIQSMANGFASGSTLSGSSTDISIGTSTPGGFTAAGGTGGNFTQYSSTKTQSLYSSTGTTVFDLYYAPEAASSHKDLEVGYFTLYGATDNAGAFPAGTLTYTALAPEPSTYALMGVGLLLLVVFRRRLSLMA